MSTTKLTKPEDQTLRQATTQELMDTFSLLDLAVEERDFEDRIPVLMERLDTLLSYVGYHGCDGLMERETA